MSSIYESRLSAQDVPFSPNNPNLKSSMPYSSSKLFRHSRLPSQNLGILNQFSLSDLVDPRQKNLSNAQVKILAKTEKNTILYNQDGKQIFKNYSQNPVAFVAVYGQKNAGKSFWCDKTYELADVLNNPNYQIKSAQNLITFSSIPYTKGNIKIFLLDCSGFNREDLTRQQELKLDTIMLLSSIVVLIPDPSDHNCSIMKTASNHFANSQKRLMYSGYPAHKKSSYWPHSLYTLYRSTQPVNKDMEQLGQLFYDYNFSIISDAKSTNYEGRNIQLSKASFFDNKIINENYMRHVSWVFRDIYDKIQAKKLGKLRMTGAITNQILYGMSQEIHSKFKVDVEKIADHAAHNLYERNYKNQQIYHQKILSAAFANDTDKGEPTHKVYQKLKSTRGQALQSYDMQSMMYDPSSKYAQLYEQKLHKKITEREIQYLQRNRLKNQKYLDKTLPHIGSYPVSKPEDLKAFLGDLKTTDKQLQQGRSQVVGTRLKQACDRTKQKLFIASEDQIQLTRIEDELQRKRRQFEELQNKSFIRKTQDHKYDQQITLLKTRNLKLTEQIQSWKRMKDTQQRIQGESDPDEAAKLKLKQLKRRKQELSSRLTQVQNNRQLYHSWLKDKDRNILDQPIVSDLTQKVEKKVGQSRMIQTTYQLNPSMIKTAERRQLDDKGIRKWRHVRK